jgi:hypothetical protein
VSLPHRSFKFTAPDSEPLEIRLSGKRLFMKLDAHARGRDLMRQTVEELQKICDDHTKAAHRNGLREFPELVVVVMDVQKQIEVVPRDWDIRSIQVFIVNLTKKYKTTTRDEVARAIARAFPHYVDYVERVPS